jgi:hypothetical protein
MRDLVARAILAYALATAPLVVAVVVLLFLLFA